MPACLYCSSEQDLTDDHVIPAALGGRLFLGNAVYKQCNNRFGHEFEAEFNNGFEAVRHVLRIPNREGEVRNLSAELFLDGESRKAIIEPSGKTTVVPYRVEKAIEGGKEIRYHFLGPTGAARLEEKMRGRGEGLEKGPPEIMEVEASATRDYDFVRLKSAQRTVAKIAYNGLALKAGIRFAGLEPFSPLKEFIRDGTDLAPVRLFLNQVFLDSFSINLRWHWVIIACDGTRQTAHVVVVLFGSLFWLVQLVPYYHGPDISQTILFDTHRGEERTSWPAMLDTELGIVNRILTGQTVWNDVEQSVACLMHYIRQERPDVQIERNLFTGKV